MKAALDGYRELLAEGDLSCAVSDALGRGGALGGGIRPLVMGARLVGPALTARTFGRDLSAVFEALALAREGEVLLIDTQGTPDCAFWGERTTRAAQARGLAGVVIDGAARDLSALTRLGFAVFGRGAVPNAGLPGGRGAVNVPVALGGMPVQPGDLVVGDENGVVVVPRLQIEQVLVQVRAALAAEAALLAQTSDPAELQPQGEPS